MDAPLVESISDLPPWLLCLSLLTFLVFAVEIGRRIGAACLRRHEPSDLPDLGAIQAALLGLLGLLLAFTYSFVATRADNRKAAVIHEANALGTAYLRTDLAPEPARSQLRDILRQYARSRLVEDRILQDPVRLRAAIADSLAIQARLWPTATAMLAGRPATPGDALILQSLNEVIDLDTVRLAAGFDRLPVPILLMLIAVAAVALLITGFSIGARGHRQLWLTTTLAVTITAVTYVIVDMDHARSGLIRVSQQSLVNTVRSMEQPPPPVTNPSP